MQKCLPQVLIGNERQLPAAMMKKLEGLPPNVYVWRCKSAWNNHALMRKYLSLLASSLQGFLQERYVILVLDMARCHIHPTILAHAKRCGIRLCYIPALMTAELQPCDTHLFSRFKASFKEAWRKEKAASAAGAVSVAQWVEIVVAAIRAVLLSTDWEAAFAGDGALAKQARLASTLCEKLGWSNPPQVNVAAYVAWQSKTVSRKRLCEDCEDGEAGEGGRCLPPSQGPQTNRSHLIEKSIATWEVYPGGSKF